MREFFAGMFFRMAFSLRPSMGSRTKDDLWYRFRFYYHYREFPSELDWAELWSHWTKKGWRE